MSYISVTSHLLPPPRHTEITLEKQPHILDPVTVLTATNLSLSRPPKIPIGLYHYPWFIFFHCTALHFISRFVLYCFVVQCIIVCLAFLFLAFWLQVQ